MSASTPLRGVSPTPHSTPPREPRTASAPDTPHPNGPGQYLPDAEYPPHRLQAEKVVNPPSTPVPKRAAPAGARAHTSLITTMKTPITAHPTAFTVSVVQGNPARAVGHRERSVTGRRTHRATQRHDGDRRPRAPGPVRATARARTDRHRDRWARSPLGTVGFPWTHVSYSQGARTRAHSIASRDRWRHDTAVRVRRAPPPRGGLAGRRSVQGSVTVFPPDGVKRVFRRQGRRDLRRRHQRRCPDPDRGQRGISGPPPPREARQSHPGSPGGVRAVGMLAVRGTRLPEPEDRGQ